MKRKKTPACRLAGKTEATNLPVRREDSINLL